jgi:O-antigen ligase
VSSLAGIQPETSRDEPAPARERRRTPRTEPVAVPDDRTARLQGRIVAAVPVTALVLFGGVEPEHALPVAAFALVLGSVALLARARRKARPLPVPALTVPVLLLAALPLVQLVPLPAIATHLLAAGFGRHGIEPVWGLSTSPRLTLLALVRWTAYAAYLVAALECLRRPAAVRAALGTIAALGVAEAAYGIVNLTSGNRSVLWITRSAYLHDATGTLVNRNHFATLLVLATSALLARRWAARRRRSTDEPSITVLYVVGATCMGLGVLLSHSRGGVLALAATLGFIAIFAPRDQEGRQGRRVAIAVMALVLAWGGWTGVGELTDRFAAGRLVEEAQRGRPALWRDALGIFVEFPVLGAGAGTFERVLPAYRTEPAGTATYAHAHQDLLELATEGGSAALALAMLAAAAFAGVVRRGFARLSGRRRLPLIALSAGIVGALLHSALDFPLHIPGLALLLLLVAAAAVRIAEAGT